MIVYFPFHFQVAKATQSLPFMDVTYPVLVPNLKGLQTALDAGVDHVAIFTAASESFCQKNTNCSVKESLQRFQAVFKVYTKLQLTSTAMKIFCGHMICVSGSRVPSRRQSARLRLLRGGLSLRGSHRPRDSGPSVQRLAGNGMLRGFTRGYHWGRHPGHIFKVRLPNFDCLRGLVEHKPALFLSYFKGRSRLYLRQGVPQTAWQCTVTTRMVKPSLTSSQDFRYILIPVCIF